MKKLTFLLLIGIFSSCSNKEEEIIGTWVETENFNLPAIVRFEKDYFYYLKNELFEKNIYLLRTDTFIFQSYGKVEKLKFNITGNCLKMYIPETDSLVYTFEKLKTSKYIDYVNDKLKTNIELVNINSDKFGLRGEVISIYLDKKDNEEPRLIFNGKKLQIDSLLYLNFINDGENFWEANTYLFIDRTLKMVVVNKVKQELSKAFRYRISYITSNENGVLFRTSLKLPPIQFYFNYPDSIRKIQPPFPPPLPHYSYIENFIENSLLLELYSDKMYLNDTLSSMDSFLNRLENMLNSGKKPIVFLFIDEQLQFEEYIRFIIKTRNIYYKVRNHCANEEYNEKDYNELPKEQSDSIISLYPMFIKEIECSELEEIKKYAL